MLLTPRYGPNPVVVLDGDPGAIGEPLVRQRRRLAEVLAQLSDHQWSQPSRCDGWSALDVAVHLASTNSFWEASIRAGLAGAPTEFLASFDPVATPAQMVAASDQRPAELVESFATSTESLATLVDELSPSDWELQAEAPPGHMSVSAVAHHALWDSWVHERDILLPLGESPAEAPDEIIASLRYVASLGPGLSLAFGATRSGGFDVSAVDPDTTFHVAIGTDVTVTDGGAGADFVLTGNAVDLVEALSYRATLDQKVPDDLDWAFSGLRTAFDG
jgi:uncharacterized protein (TIGR03083 family)